MKTILLSILLIPFCCLSQNWDLFNKNYRYNYKYNNSALISNVLFADSVKQSGTDTIYHLNRIGVQCPGTCFNSTTTAVAGQTLVIGNMPQFLQRTIKKSSTGAVSLLDTAALDFPSQINQLTTWTFDNNSSVSALCSTVGVQSLFGAPDSVKTILLNGTDTIKLSKSYGIIVFPELYTKNKYYRLVGIENRHRYDQTALYGIKVPNAWDFYNFQIGDHFCHDLNVAHMNGPSYYTAFNQIAVLSKTVTPSGYEYLVNEYSCKGISSSFNPPCNVWPFAATYTLVYKRLFRDSMIENKMYPKMLLEGRVSGDFFNDAFEVEYDKKGGFANVVELVGSSTGRQFKVFGDANRWCSNNTSLPQGKYKQGLHNNGSTKTYSVAQNMMNAALFGTGLGLMGADFNIGFEHSSKTCMLCSPDFGKLAVNTPEDFNVAAGLDIYPNPANNSFTIASTKIKSLTIYNLVGQKVLTQNVSADKIIDCSNFPSGVYIVVAEGEGQWIVKKISVQH